MGDWTLESIPPKRGVGLSRMTRKVCENNIEFQSQLKGCVKNLVIDFPDTPVKVTDREEGGLGLKRKMDYVATVSNRK